MLTASLQCLGCSRCSVLSCSFLGLLWSPGVSALVGASGAVDLNLISKKKITNLSMQPSCLGLYHHQEKGWLMFSAGSKSLTHSRGALLWLGSAPVPAAPQVPPLPVGCKVYIPATLTDAVGVFLLVCSACNCNSTNSSQAMSLYHYNYVFLGYSSDFLGTANRASLQMCTLASCTLHFPFRAPCARL